MTPALLLALSRAAGVHAELMPDGRVLCAGVVVDLDVLLALWGVE